MKKGILFLSLLILTAQVCLSQDTLTADQMRVDFTYMMGQYESIHPNPAWSLGGERYNDMKRQTLAQLNHPMTHLDFWKVIAQWNQYFDGHTLLNWPQAGRTPENVTPFPPKSIVQYRDHKLYFSSYEAMPDSLRGCEITSVNGHTSTEIINTILPYISHESEALINTNMLQSLNYYFGFFFDYESRITFRYRTASGERSVALDRETVTSWVRKIVNRIRERAWHFEVFPEQGIALLEFNKCRPDERLEQFDSEVGAFIDSVNRLGIRHLFVDLSQNQGGNDMFCYRFLRHIATVPDSAVLFDYVTTDHGTIAEPEEQRYTMAFYPAQPRYDGNLYFIQSQFTFSAAVVLANLAKQYGFGTLIGEESGGLTTTYIRLNQRKLPNSGLTFYCSDKQNRYFGTTGPRGVMPDIPYEIGYKYLFRSFDIDTLQKIYWKYIRNE